MNRPDQPFQFVPGSSWAVQPLDFAGAAKTLGVGKSTLEEFIRTLSPDVESYELRGVKRVF